MKRHISFDFWDTLAKANPQFGVERVKLFSERMGVDEETAKHHYFGIKRFADREAEEHGNAYSTLDFYAMTMRQVRLDISEEEIIEISDLMQALALKYPPIFRDDTIQMIKALHERGVTISITSNSNFISGLTLRQIMINAGLVFDFGIFSDEILFSKPAPEIFTALKDEFTPDTVIYHYGDNKICDLDGANNFGIIGRLISYDTLAETLLEDFIPHHSN